MINQIPWSKEAETGLLKSAGTDLELIKNQVINKTAQLWKIDTKTAKGYLVTRIDCEGIGKVFVFVLGEGRQLGEVIPHFITSAQNHGIKHFRTHVQRKGLIRMWQKFGLTIDHYVLRNDTNG